MQNEGKERLHLVNPTREQVIETLSVSPDFINEKPDKFRIKTEYGGYYFVWMCDGSPIEHEGSNPCVFRIQDSPIYVVREDGTFEYHVFKTMLFMDNIHEIVGLTESEWREVRDKCDNLETAVKEVEKALKQCSQYVVNVYEY